jgi:hypothetical protein
VKFVMNAGAALNGSERRGSRERCNYGFCRTSLHFAPLWLLFVQRMSLAPASRAANELTAQASPRHRF